jgi:glycyl-tRNA synthetase
VISLINSDNHMKYVEKICDILSNNPISAKSYRTDTTSVSIGKKYARLDEIGTEVVFTVDNQTLEDDTCTIRYRDTMEQSRISISDLTRIIIKHNDEIADYSKSCHNLCKI